MSQDSSVEANSTPIIARSRSVFASFTPQDIAISICALVLVVTFFLPWAIKVTGTFDSEAVSAAGFMYFSPVGKFLWVLPLTALATIVAGNSTRRRHLGTITAIIAWFCVLAFSVSAYSLNIRFQRSGIAFTQLFALCLFAFSGKQRITAPLDFVAKKLGSRKAELFSHSGTLTPDVHFSTQEFYANIEQEIRAKEWPGVSLLRIKYSEAGALSHKREYLRIIRHRQVFDLCAATFGRDYFFSLREAQIPAVITFRAFLFLWIGIPLVFSFFAQLFGPMQGVFVFLAFLLFGVWFLFNVLKMGLTKVDSLLIQLPAIGPIYETFFRKDTYFQQDTRLVFLQSVSELVKRHIEETTSAKGIQVLSCFERQPVLEGLYRRYRKSVKTETPVEALAS